MMVNSDLLAEEARARMAGVRAARESGRGRAPVSGPQQLLRRAVTQWRRHGEGKPAHGAAASTTQHA
jgi:hypothetical protein